MAETASDTQKLKELTVESLWETFRKNSTFSNPSEEQMASVKLVFYAGASHVFFALTQDIAALTEVDAQAVLERLHKELVAHHEERLAEARLLHDEAQRHA